MARMTKILAALLFAIISTASNSPEKFMTSRQPKINWGTCFKDLMIALNVGLFSYIIFIRVLELPLIIGFIEIGFAAVICCLTMTKPWTTK